MISSNCISAEVVSYSLSTEGWLKEIKYVIKVVDTSGESEILRGSKDFKVLQKILITRWPGCKIPVIPSDFSQKNPPPSLYPSFLHVHNVFLLQLTSSDFLVSSEVSQLFLKGPTDFIKLTSAYHIPSYPKIAESFENSFKDSIDYQMNEDTPGILHDRKEAFKLQLKKVSSLEKLLTGQSSALKDFKSANAKFLGLVEQTHKWIDPGYPEGTFEVEHPEASHSFSLWLLEQMLVLESLIQAIEKIEELGRVKDLTVRSIQSTSLEIQKLSLGKKSLSMIFNNKSKDEFFNAKSKTLEDLNSQLKALEIMIPLLSSKMLSDTILRTEQLTGAEFEKQVKLYTSELCKDLQNFREKLVRNSN